MAFALSACASPSVLRNFTTDGCSAFPDGDAAQPERWRTCCVRHDAVYWRGGPAEQRLSADQDLRACVLEKTARPALAALMYCGVRIGGTPWLPTHFRWAYGWDFWRGYRVLTRAEQQQADDLLAASRDHLP